MPYVSDHHYRRLFVDLQVFYPSKKESPASSCTQKKKTTMAMKTKMIFVCFSRGNYEVRLWFRLASRRRFQFRIEPKNLDPGLHLPINLTRSSTVRSFQLSVSTNFQASESATSLASLSFVGPLNTTSTILGFSECEYQLGRAVHHPSFLAQRELHIYMSI